MVKKEVISYFRYDLCYALGKFLKSVCSITFFPFSTSLIHVSLIYIFNERMILVEKFGRIMNLMKE